MTTHLVTGTLGFIFSNFVRRCADRCAALEPGLCLVGVDKAVHKYNLDNAWSHTGYTAHLADIADAHTIDNIFEIERPSVVIGGAAESFVDDAIRDVMPFLHSNVIGTQVLVNACLKYNARYIHISTDEVYGQLHSVDDVPWSEDAPLHPRNPYAASKACAEHIVRAAGETHGLKYNIVRSCNVYGPRQKMINLLPHVITGLIERRPIRIHGNGRNFRQYVHVDDCVDGILTVLSAGRPGQSYNVGGEDLVTNLQMVHRLGDIAGRTPHVTHIEDRKGHDFGYHVDSSKLRELGWAPKVKLDDGLRRLVAHYRSLAEHVYAA